MSISNSVDALELFYKKYRKGIFTKLIWAHLFDDDARYEDKDIFEKTEKYLSSFFTSQGFEWSNENRAKIHQWILNSDNAKLIADYFQKNYEQCLTDMLNWTPDTSVQRMVNQLIDASIQNKTKLNYYYAKRLLVKYYYDLFITSTDKERVIGNLMIIFFTYNDIQRLAGGTGFDLDSLITKSYNSLNKVIGAKESKINPKFFIRKFVMLRSFHYSLRYNPKLKEKLSNCQYVPVYRDLLDEIENRVKEIPVKEIQRQTVSKKQNAASETKTNDNSNTKADSNDAMDLFLKKIGGRNHSMSDPIAALLCASEDIIRNSEEHSAAHETLGDIYFSEEFKDAAIDELRY